MDLTTPETRSDSETALDELRALVTEMAKMPPEDEAPEFSNELGCLSCS